MVAITRQLFTVDDYYKMAEVGILKAEDRVELIYGEIVQKSIRSKHSAIVDKLTRLINHQLFEQVLVKTQNPIRLSQFSEPEPDVAVVNFKEDEYINGHPTAQDVLLLIEVSDSTLSMDQKVKAKLYAESNIVEYWIINLPDLQIEKYTNPQKDKYEEKAIFKKGEKAISSNTNFEIEVDELFKFL